MTPKDNTHENTTHMNHKTTNTATNRNLFASFPPYFTTEIYRDFIGIKNRTVLPAHIVQ